MQNAFNFRELVPLIFITILYTSVGIAEHAGREGSVIRPEAGESAIKAVGATQLKGDYTMGKPIPIAVGASLAGIYKAEKTDQFFIVVHRRTEVGRAPGMSELAETSTLEIFEFLPPSQHLIPKARKVGHIVPSNITEFQKVKVLSNDGTKLQLTTLDTDLTFATAPSQKTRDLVRLDPKDTNLPQLLRDAANLSIEASKWISSMNGAIDIQIGLDPLGSFDFKGDFDAEKLQKTHKTFAEFIKRPSVRQLLKDKTVVKISLTTQSMGPFDNGSSIDVGDFFSVTGSFFISADTWASADKLEAELRSLP